jgi:hypothetical protein
LLQTHLVEGRVALQAGVADRNVQRPEMRDSGREHGLHLIFLADVGLERDGLAAHALDFVGDLVGRFRVGDVVHHDVRTGSCQPQRDRPTDARIGACDKRWLTG